MSWLKASSFPPPTRPLEASRLTGEEKKLGSFFEMLPFDLDAMAALKESKFLRLGNVPDLAGLLACKGAGPPIPRTSVVGIVRSAGSEGRNKPRQKRLILRWSASLRLR
jgi:hypothetical protein